MEENDVKCCKYDAHVESCTRQIFPVNVLVTVRKRQTTRDKERAWEDVLQ